MSRELLLRYSGYQVSFLRYLVKMIQAFFFFLAALFVGEHWLFIAIYGLSLVSGLPSMSSAAVVHGLSCPEACGVFSDQGSNLCPSHWPLDHQGRPRHFFFFLMRRGALIWKLHLLKECALHKRAALFHHEILGHSN